MFDWISSLISIALYVLQALGLYTIAQRRGIKYAWLAWVPVGSAWILGCICDDFKARTKGGAPKLRIALLILTIAVMVLSAVSVGSAASALGSVLTTDEMMDMFYISSGGSDLYTVSEEEFIGELAEKLETRLTDEMAEQLLEGVLVMTVASLLLAGAAIATAVIECICVYSLYDSCDPKNKVLFLLLGLFLGVQGLFIFLCRNKDAVSPASLPNGYDRPPQEPWNV